jgi:hypothetical protein
MSEANSVYLVRDDTFYCLFTPRPKFVAEFVELLQKYVPVKVIAFDARKQVEDTEAWVKKNYPEHVVLSLDKWYRGDFQLDFSRIFKKSGEQKTPENFNLSDGDRFFLASWLWENRSKKILIVDDDIASGTTIKAIKKIIGESCINLFSVDTLSMMDVSQLVDETITLPERVIPLVYDIIDIRDFIPNAVNGGLLCIDEEGELSRELYLHPTVNLCTRMKLTEENAVLFTDEVKTLISKHFLYVR